MELVLIGPNGPTDQQLTTLRQVIRQEKTAWVLGLCPQLTHSLQRPSNRERIRAVEAKWDYFSGPDGPRHAGIKEDTLIAQVMDVVEQVGARDAIVVLGDTLDSLAAAAVLMVRQKRSTSGNGSYLTEEQRHRAVLLRSVVRARRLRRLPLKLPSLESLWADSADYPEANQALWPVLIAAGAANCSLEERIQCLYTWIKVGKLPSYCQELALFRREALLSALADPGAIRLERQFRGRLVLVQGLNCWGAHFLGFSEEPVVVEFSPKYADGGEPITPRLGVWQSGPHYVDMPGVLAELGWSGDAWGGSFSSDHLNLAYLDRVCEVVRRHRSIK